MKKVLLSLCLLMSGILMSSHQVNAEGYYYEETIEIIEENISRASSSKTGEKIGTYRNSSGEKQWEVIVTGTFTYNGSTSTCTKASVSVNVYNNYWHLYSKSASKSENKAIGKATCKLYSVSGNVIDTVSKTVTLTCSASGKLS